MTKSFEENIEHRLSQLINEKNLETAPFKDDLNGRRLLWPFGLRDDGSEINLIQGIINACQQNNKDVIYVKLIGDPSYYDAYGKFHKRTQYYQFKLENFDKYYNDELIQGSARIIFAQSQDWVLIITFEGFALLGTRNELMKKVEAVIPELSKYYNHQDFLDYWEMCKKRNGVDISWVSKLLKHINVE